MLVRIVVCSLVAVLGMAAASAQTSSDASSQRAVSAAQSTDALSDGEVKKVDKSAGKVTIRHGEIRNLDMPPMTMVFRVRDPAMLDKLKEGDRIKFTADKVKGIYTVTSVEAAK